MKSGVDSKLAEATAPDLKGHGLPYPAEPDSTSQSNKVRRQKAPWFVFASLIGLPLIGVWRFGSLSAPGSLTVVELLLSAASLASGMLGGFLFGIPRTPTQIDTGNVTTGSTDTDRTRQVYRRYSPGNSLEQIADWLTKILIGIGLIQLREIANALASVGDRIRTSFPNVTGADELTQLVVVLFATSGFLLSYLWTRLYYGAIQTFADQDIYEGVSAAVERIASRIDRQDDKIDRQDDKTDQSLRKSDISLRVAKASAGGMVQSEEVQQPLVSSPTERESVEMDKPARPELPLQSREEKARIVDQDSVDPTGLSARLRQFNNAPNRWDTDPVASLFPDASSFADGRRLSASISEDLGDSLLIALRVTQISGPPLTGDVLFLLHPSYSRRTRRVKSKSHVAETEIVAEGWFTVGAIVESEGTVLTFDLRQMENTPKWFKNK